MLKGKVLGSFLSLATTQARPAAPTSGHPPDGFTRCTATRPSRSSTPSRRDRHSAFASTKSLLLPVWRLCPAACPDTPLRRVRPHAHRPATPGEPSRRRGRVRQPKSRGGWWISCPGVASLTHTLSQPDGLLNGERVEIVTRDRNQPSVILSGSAAALRRLHHPAIHRASRLPRAGAASTPANPVSLRVTHESDTGGDAFWSYGIDAHVRVCCQWKSGRPLPRRRPGC
jgi:hypothetical protein